MLLLVASVESDQKSAQSPRNQNRRNALEGRVRHRLLLPPEPQLLPVQHQDHHLVIVVCVIG